MSGTLSDKLKNVNMDFSSYGAFPSRDDIFLIEPKKEEDKKARALVKQWEKLSYIRSNLKTIDRYIKSASEENLGDWLKKNNLGMSAVVLDKIGTHNNETGGISAYFFNLQKFYDDEEAKYDIMEANSTPTPDIEISVASMRDARGNRRKARTASRKLFMRDMKADGKGYLKIEEEMPVHNADGTLAEDKSDETKKDSTATEPKKEDEKKPIVTEVKNTNKRIGIFIAGTLIFITAMVVAGSITTEQKQ